MHISKLKIKNFKCFDEVEIEFDPNFNLIIGENNSGKSTVFEALRLWQLAFIKFLKDRTNNQESSFRVYQYFSFTIDDISFLRVTDFKKLFQNNSIKQIELSLTISNGNEEVTIPIFFSKTSEGQVLKFELCKTPGHRKTESEKLSKVVGKPLGSDFKEIFLFTYINPIFLLPVNEAKHSKGYIINKLHEAKANEIIRNLIFEISPERKSIKKETKNNKLSEIENSIKQILNIESISFSRRLEDEESYIKIFSKNEITGVDVEINQLGSGTINVLNILAVLAYGDYEKFMLNSLLLDEPDSHLHSDHQKRLYSHLEKISKDTNKQIFVITHNHELIEASDKVIYLDKQKIKKDKKLTAISNEEYNIIYRDLSKQYYQSKLELIEKKEIEKKVKELTKPTLYCEGSTDVTILKEAYFKIYNSKVFFDDKIDIQDGNSESGVGQYIKSNQKKEIFIIGLLDNDRAGQNQVTNLTKNIASPYSIKQIIADFHYQKFYQDQSFNTHIVLLPIPSFRIEEADFFKKNLFIEYMFSNDVLKNKLDVNMFSEKGTTYEKIIIGEDGKILNSEKEKITKNISKLSNEDFNYFIPLFEKIAEIIDFVLPKNNA